MESLLETVEERITALISELTLLRQQNQTLWNENALLKSAQQQHYARLQDLATLLQDMEPQKQD